MKSSLEVAMEETNLGESTENLIRDFPEPGGRDKGSYDLVKIPYNTSRTHQNPDDRMTRILLAVVFFEIAVPIGARDTSTGSTWRPQ